MNQKIILHTAILTAIILTVLTLPYSTYAMGFAVGPTNINLTVQDDGTSSTTIYLLSDGYEGEIIVGSEGIPFSVYPEVISINKTDYQKKVDLTVYGNKSVSDGPYHGSLTFLGSTGENVMSGVKIKTVVHQIGQEGFLDSITDDVQVNLIFILLTIVSILVLITAITFMRRKKGA